MTVTDETRVLTLTGGRVVVDPATKGLRVIRRVVIDTKRGKGEFRETEHPRDSAGKFIETFAEVRIWGGGSGRVTEMLPGGRVRVERADGTRVDVDSAKVTVTRDAAGQDVAPATPAPRAPGAAAPAKPVDAPAGTKPAPDATPDGAYASFTGENGARAWIEENPDGGPPRAFMQADPNDPGSTVEYDDPGEWADDVDTAGMSPTDQPAAEAPPAEAAPETPATPAPDAATPATPPAAAETPAVDANAPEGAVTLDSLVDSRNINRDKDQWYQLDWNDDRDNPNGDYASNPANNRPVQLRAVHRPINGTTTPGADDLRALFSNDQGSQGEMELPPGTRLTPIPPPADTQLTGHIESGAGNYDGPLYMLGGGNNMFPAGTYRATGEDGQQYDVVVDARGRSTINPVADAPDTTPAAGADQGNAPDTGGNAPEGGDTGGTAPTPLTVENVRAADWQETIPGQRWEATLPDGRFGIVTFNPEGFGNIPGGYRWAIKDDPREPVLADDSGYDFYPGMNEALTGMVNPNPDRGIHPTLRDRGGGGTPPPPPPPDPGVDATPDGTYRVGQTVDVQTTDFATPGMPPVWRRGTVERITTDPDTGLSDVFVRGEDGSALPSQRVGRRAGGNQIRSLADDWGTPYGGDGPAYDTPDGPVTMRRKGQRVRFYDENGSQVGPEQSNVAPAMAYAQSQGWTPPGPAGGDQGGTGGAEGGAGGDQGGTGTPAGGTEGGETGTPVGDTPVIESVRSTAANVRALNAELTAQGVDPMSPIRGVINGQSGRFLAISRDPQTNAITGAIDYDIDRGLHNVSMFNVRALTERQGIGQAMIRHIAEQTSGLPRQDEYGMTVYGAIGSAKPFYVRTGANIENPGSSVLTWSPETTRRLRDGEPVEPGYIMPPHGSRLDPNSVAGLTDPERRGWERELTDRAETQFPFGPIHDEAVADLALLRGEVPATGGNEGGTEGGETGTPGGEVAPPPPPDITPPDPDQPTTVEDVTAADLQDGDRVLVEGLGVVTVLGSEDDGDRRAIGYRDANGVEGTIYADRSEVMQRIGNAPPNVTVDPPDNPPVEMSDAQVRVGDLQPGARVWLGGRKAEVTAVGDSEQMGPDIRMVTLRWPDRTTQTLPFGRDVVLDSAEDRHLPDPSPLDGTVPTARPVLYTYQRRNLVALGLDNDADPMVAEAARRIRVRQPLSSAHADALANRLAQEAQAPGVRPQRQRMLLRLAGAQNAAAIEAGGRGVDLPEMPNANRVTPARPDEVGVGDQIAFMGARNALSQGKVTNVRRMMGGRLTEVTFEDPDGTVRTTLLSRNTGMFVLPDLPDPTPLPRPASNAPELVDVGDLRPGDRVHIPNTHELFDAEQSRTEATVLRVGTEPSGNQYAILDVHSVYSNEDDQALVLTSNPDQQQGVIRSARGPESADQPRKTDLPEFNEQEITASEVAVGDWLRIGNGQGSVQGIITDVEPIMGEGGDRLGTRYRYTRPSGSSNWQSVLDVEDRPLTRLASGDTNTILRLQEQKRARARRAAVLQATSHIDQPLGDYTNQLGYQIGQNALTQGREPDADYEDNIRQAFDGTHRAANMEMFRDQAVRRMARNLQTALTGESSGAAFDAAREPAFGLAEQIMADHHDRLRRAMLNAHPTEPGMSRSMAGRNLAYAISRGEADIETRDLNRLAEGVVNAREAAAAANAARTGEGTPDTTVPPLSEGASLRDRMAAYKRGLGTRFGFRDSTVTTFGEFNLDSLERGQVPELGTAVGRTRDTAPDGGPGADTMTQLDTLRGAGADVSAAIDARLRDRFPDPDGALAALKDTQDRNYQTYLGVSNERNTVYDAVKDRLAREEGFESWDDLSDVAGLLARRADRDAYEERTGRKLPAVRTDLMLRVMREPEMVDYGDRAQQWNNAYKAARQKRLDFEAQLAEGRAQATLEALAEARDMGGRELTYHGLDSRKKIARPNGQDLSDAEALGAMRHAEKHYPREWLDALAGKKPIGVGKWDRGFFFEGTWMIRLSKDDNRNNETGWTPPRGRVAIHELGHAMERAVPGLLQAEEAYLWSRSSTGEVGQRRRTRRINRDKAPVYEDEFPDWYSGKDYGGAYELLTTGMESLFAGSSYLDDDMRNWLLGTLALL